MGNKIEEIKSEYSKLRGVYGNKIDAAKEKLMKKMNFSFNSDNYSEEYAIEEESYLRAVETMLKNHPCNLWVLIYSNCIFYYYEGQEVETFDFFSKLEKKYNYPADFKELFEIIGIEKGQTWPTRSFGGFLGLTHLSTGLRYYQAYQKEIKLLLQEMTDLFPPFILNRAVFFCTINAEQFLFTWLLNKDDEAETGEILILDIVDRTISRLSNNMANFLLRGVECIKIEQIQDIYEPNEEVLQIIRQIDGDNVLPSKSAIYELDDLKSFPDNWKKMLTKKDYDFEL